MSEEVKAGDSELTDVCPGCSKEVFDDDQDGAQHGEQWWHADCFRKSQPSQALVPQPDEPAWDQLPAVPPQGGPVLAEGMTADNALLAVAPGQRIMWSTMKKDHPKYKEWMAQATEGQVTEMAKVANRVVEVSNIIICDHEQLRDGKLFTLPCMVLVGELGPICRAYGRYAVRSIQRLCHRDIFGPPPWAPPKRLLVSQIASGTNHLYKFIPEVT